MDPLFIIVIIAQMSFITKEGLKQLDEYRYKGGGYTWLDNKMNPFWQATAKMLPQWMAPNLVTFIGWIFVILSYTNMLFYDINFTKIIPRWTFLVAAVFIFIYQTMDAIDGKQARRTKSSSPLGQLFDHGCDSFSMSFFLLAVFEAFRVDQDIVFFAFMTGQMAWWSSNWIEYHTGVLQTGVGNFGVTEVELLLCGIHLITGLFGQEVWDISIANVDLKSVVVIGICLPMLLLCILSVYRMMSANPSKIKQMCYQVGSILLLLAIEYIWLRLPFYRQFSGLVLLNFGIMTSKLICKVIVSSVTHMELKMPKTELGIFVLTTIIMLALSNMQLHGGVKFVFWICFADNLISTLLFLKSTIKQITDYMGIYCFSLAKKARKLQ